MSLRIRIATALACFVPLIAIGEISDQDLEYYFGESAAYREVFEKVQSTIANDDRQGFAALVHYPFTIYREKEECCGSEAVDTVEDSAEFVERFDEIVTPAIRKIILKQKFDDLILNWRGLGFDLGTVWIVGYCVSGDDADPCQESVVRIKSVLTDSAKDVSE